MSKDLKKFILLLIVSVIVAFTVSFSHSVYQNYQREKKVNEIKNIFSFGTTVENTEDSKNNIKVEEVEKSDDPKENWNNVILNDLESLGYSKVNTRPFYKRLYDKLTGKKVYNYKSNSDENKTLVVEIKDNKIVKKFFDKDKEVLEQELIANEDYSSYDSKSYDFETKITSTYKDVLGKDTYLNTKNGFMEYEDGRVVEFTHEAMLKNGPAVENLPNGDKIEFTYVADKRFGEAQKFYKNGDIEQFSYDENEVKNGYAIYKFANGETEEYSYKNGVVEGPAIYIYKDGWAQHYEYKDGKRVEN